MDIECDVAIIGGGPGGSTCGGLLAKYGGNLDIRVFEREQFPREHIGESQLPPISVILQELGCWDEVERANFPIKIGATYRWGHSEKLWDFEFMPIANYREEARPRRFSSQAKQLAFQVDRAIYDDILLRNAERLGCRIEMPAGVRSVEMTGDHVDNLVLEDGRRVRARHYVDASGNAAILRRKAGVKIDAPTKLQNIAFWDYWENTEWGIRFPGGATRVLVMSIGSGWIWFIPMGPSRTSIGFVCPRDYYSQSGKRPEEIYLWALSQEPLISRLTSSATREGQVRATKDWSYVADRVVGENWFMVGEAAGFADPILAAGMTLTQTSGRECAYTILALDRGEHDAAWLRRCYNENQRTRVQQHIRFADFWYSANGVFTDLQAYTSEIARDAGLELSPQKAFQWLGTGGFTDDVLGQVGLGGLDLAGARQVAQRLLPGDYRWKLSDVNRFWMTTEGVQRDTVPAYADGRVHQVPCLRRGNRKLPLCGLFKRVADALAGSNRLSTLMPRLQAEATLMSEEMLPDLALHHLIQALELMVSEGWVRSRHDPKEPRLQLGTPYEGRFIHSNNELAAQWNLVQ